MKKTMGHKKSSPEAETQGMTDEDFRRLNELAAEKFSASLQGVVGSDAIGRQNCDNL